MAKGYVDPALQKILEETKSKHSTTFQFTNSRGIEVTLTQIPPYLIQMVSSSVDIPKPPTYEVEVLGGGKEIHVHDEESIAQSSEEEKQLWREFQVKARAAELQVSDRILDIILLEGLRVPEADLEKFAKRMKTMRIVLAEDSEERELQIKRAYVVGNQEDAEAIVRIVMSLTQVSSEAVKDVQDSFPDRV